MGYSWGEAFSQQAEELRGSVTQGLLRVARSPPAGAVGLLLEQNPSDSREGAQKDPTSILKLRNSRISLNDLRFVTESELRTQVFGLLA